MTTGSRIALVALVTYLAGVRPAAADIDEWVRLKDGTVVQGALVELTPNDHITIHLATGEIRRSAWADIDSSGTGTSAASAPPPSMPPAAPTDGAPAPVVIGSPAVTATA